MKRKDRQAHENRVMIAICLGMIIALMIDSSLKAKHEVDLLNDKYNECRKIRIRLENILNKIRFKESCPLEIEKTRVKTI